MSLLVRGLALAGVLLAAACTRSVPDIIEKAKAYRAKGENAAALVELNNARVAQPKNPESFLLTGLALTDLGDLTKADNALRRALEYGQPAAEVLPALGRVLLELESYAEILDALKSELKFAPPVMAELAVLRGRAHAGLGELAEARAQFQLAAGERPAQAKLGLARIAAAERDFAGADALIDEALAVQKDSAEAWILRGDLRRAEGKIDDAAAAYEQAAKAAPRNPAPLVSRALILMAREQNSDAQALLVRAGEIAGANPFVHYAKALLANKEKRYEDANAELARVFTVMPKHYPAMLLAGRTNYATGRYDLAQQALGTVLLRYPGDLNARRLLAATLMAKGQPHLAINILDPVLPKTKDAGLLAMAAEANRQTGQARRAERLLEAAVKFEPKNPELHTSLGIVRLTAGLKQRGIADLEAAVALNPLHARADEALIFALLGEKQVERAEQAVSALEKRLPDRAETHTLRGAVWLAKKDDAKARVSFERALQISPALLPAAEALAEIDTREGKPDAMRQRTEAILKHDSKHLGALLTLARLDAAAGRQAESVARIRLALSAHPNAINAMLMLAQTQLQFGNAAEAVITAQQAAKAYPYDTRAFKVLADAQVDLGNALGLYASWPAPTTIIVDGPYGVGGFPGDPPTPHELGAWYAPHAAEWAQHAMPETTLWFWGTEVGWAKHEETADVLSLHGTSKPVSHSTKPKSGLKEGSETPVTVNATEITFLKVPGRLSL